MRSLPFTLLLALAAAATCVVAGWSLTHGNLDRLFGAPATPAGERLYPDLQPAAVTGIQVSGQGVEAAFVKTENGWRVVRPWQDRMDPRAAQAILGFTAGLRVEDYAPVSDLDENEAGLGESAIHIRLEGSGGEPLAKFALGRRTPWLATLAEDEPAVPTVFIRTRDSRRKNHIYACTGDISPLFKDGMKFLRDHRPFHFNPLRLESIRIRTEEGELTLGRPSPEAAWRIVKPLELPTDPAAIKALLEGLYELQAARVDDRSALTPTAESTGKSRQIAIRSFESDEEILLEILPGDSADARDVPAHVSDRPDTLFLLPAKPEPGLISLADLPLTVNDLRDPTLTHLNIAALRGIAIESLTQPEILIHRNPPAPWRVRIGEQEFDANEGRLFDLLKTVTTSRATGFVSDAATDLSPWGLDRPALRLTFLAADHQRLELAFGITSDGQVHVNRSGSPTVMRVDRSVIAGISVRPYEWRHARPWSISRVDLMAIERTEGDAPPLLLRYDYLGETWLARDGEREVGDDLVPARANFLLGALETFQVERWLAAGDEAAVKALATPSLRFRILERKVDDFGDETGRQRRELILAPAPGNDPPAFYYGRIEGEPHEFRIDRDTYRKLSVELLE